MMDNKYLFVGWMDGSMDGWKKSEECRRLVKITVLIQEECELLRTLRNRKSFGSEV